MSRFTLVILMLLNGFFVSAATSATTDEIENSRLQISNALKGNSVIIVASRKTEPEVVQFVNNFYQQKNLTKDDVTLTTFLSDNGWFAISVGDVDQSQCNQVANNLKNQNLIPGDSYCSDAKKYIAAFNVQDNQLQPLIGRNYYANDANENEQLAENQKTGNENAQSEPELNFELLINNRAFEALQKMDGSLKVTALRSNGSVSICTYVDANSGEALDEGFMQILKLSMKEFFKDNKFDLKGNDFRYDGACTVAAQYGQDKPELAEYPSELAIVYSPVLANINFGKWLRLGQVTDAKIREIAQIEDQKAQKQAELVRNLQAEYENLAENDSKTKLGSLNVSYPEEREELRICTTSIKGDEAIPFIEYVSYDDGALFSSGLRQAVQKSSYGSSAFSEGYKSVFDNVEEFFLDWQKTNGNNCNVWVGYPAELVSFIAAAKRVNNNFAYEFNKLIDVNLLYQKWSLERGYKSWEQVLFGRSISANSQQLSELERLGIKELSAWNDLSNEILDEKYADRIDQEIVLAYLRDREEGRSLNKSAMEVLLEREERQAEEQRRKTAQKVALAKAEAKRRANNIEKGEGLFKHYKDDSCKEKENEYCVNKEEFKSICKKVGWRTIGSGYGVDIFGLSLVLQSQQMRDLYRNNRTSSVSGEETYVTKNGECYFTYQLSGLINGTSLNKTMYCRVSGIEGKDGKFYSKNVSDCFSR